MPVYRVLIDGTEYTVDTRHMAATQLFSMIMTPVPARDHARTRSSRCRISPHPSARTVGAVSLSRVPCSIEITSGRIRAPKTPTSRHTPYSCRVPLFYIHYIHPIPVYLSPYVLSPPVLVVRRSSPPLPVHVGSLAPTPCIRSVYNCSMKSKHCVRCVTKS